jgi:hypothetical protein
MAVSNTIPGCWCIISTDNYRELSSLHTVHGIVIHTILYNEIENQNSEFTEMTGYW